MLAAGAKGFLSKSADKTTLVSAIRQVSEGHDVVPVQVAAMLGDRAALPRLSPREHDVLQLMAEGLTNCEIAERLHLAEGTIRLYCSTLFMKLSAKRRTEAVAIALKLGLTKLIS